MLIMKHTTAHGVENAMSVHTPSSIKKKKKLDLFTGGLVETAFLNRRISTTDSLPTSVVYYPRKEYYGDYTDRYCRLT